MKVLRICILLLLSLGLHSCKSGGTTDNGSTFCNPVWKGTSNTSMFYHDGLTTTYTTGRDGFTSGPLPTLPT